MKISDSSLRPVELRKRICAHKTHDDGYYENRLKMIVSRSRRYIHLLSFLKRKNTLLFLFFFYIFKFVTVLFLLSFDSFECSDSTRKLFLFVYSESIYTLKGKGVQLHIYVPLKYDSVAVMFFNHFGSFFFYFAQECISD